MNFFTPELGPPLAEDTDWSGWRERVTRYLNGLREALDTRMEAFLSKGAQVGDIWTEQSGTATAAVGANELLTFTPATSIPFTYRSPFVMARTSVGGWAVGVVEASGTAIIVTAMNHSGTGANATVTVRYF